MPVGQNFCKCLYFTSNRLARLMNKIAEEEFSYIGLSPMHAFLLMTVSDQPGITQKELSDILHIAPSTSTRFVEKLEAKQLVYRKNEGKMTFVYLTEKGIGIQDDIKRCWRNLYKRYAQILGDEDAQRITQQIDEVCDRLEKK
ncbi:MarR family transcriptional regulator [Anoxybacillus flavithermus]|uniref:MarR family transcriptional regulator n=1 Tax=Anoxybacillus flavithermus TaxID=33934 RepID=A0A2G5RUF5_9BACL|nr:MarR family winged helix-turn-helix transcriptional regulator [Anoxybacillus flavithermus]PIC06299.1 MarR family transcriptional regulator [Anoxybacillus flavithermus]